MSGIIGGGEAAGGGGNNTVQPQAAGFRVQTSAYGLVIPLVFGRQRMAGNMIWYGAFTPIPHTTSSSSGGGGGGKGGGPSEQTTSSTSWTYTASFALAVCEGPITSFNGAWRDKDILARAFSSVVSGGAPFVQTQSDQVPNSSPFSIRATVDGAAFVSDAGVWCYDNKLIAGTDYSVDATGLYTFVSTVRGRPGWMVTINFNAAPTSTSGALFTGFTGSYPQTPWSYLTSNFPGKDLGYQGITYAAAANYDLGNSDNLQNHTFDVTGIAPFNPSGRVYDASVKDILTQFLTNTHFGAGFPASKLGDWTLMNQYTLAAGLLFSPAISTQSPAQEFVASMALLANCGIFFSEGLLKCLPYGDSAEVGNGQTYTPNNTAQYDLGDDDYLVESPDDPPITVKRTANSDAFNQASVEFVNRANDYNVEVSEAKDQVQIDTYGQRNASSLTAHEIADPATARKVAQIALQRALYIRSTYEFRLGWKYCLLEPMDLLTLTDSALGFNRLAVRIISTEENEQGDISVVAEDFLLGVSSAPRYSSQAAGGYTVSLNKSSGNTNPPVVFEPPDFLTTTGLEVWLAASGGATWGGCEVWVSEDGATYRRIGSTTAPSIMGVTTSTLAAVADPDTTSTLGVDLTVSSGLLANATQTAADAFNTLCYAGGELISYASAALTALSKYNLTYLRRGVYNTPLTSHAVGSQFAKIDNSLFKYPFTSDKIGTTLYIKLPSFNIYGGGLQNLADVNPTTYIITGSAIMSPLPNVANLVTKFVANLLNLRWDYIADFRQPNIDYEVRIGPSWATGQVVGRTPLNEFVAIGNGTYWVAAHFLAAGGVNVYSATPTSLVVTGSALSRNVLVTWPEAPAWTGTITANAIVSGANVSLTGSGNILGIANILTTPDVLYYGGVASSGMYTSPAGHEVNTGRVAGSLLSMSYTVTGQSIFDNVLTLPNILLATDLLGAALGPLVNLQPQVAVADASHTFGAWQNFTPGVYSGQYFKSRFLLTSSDVTVAPQVSAFSFTVDMPDRVDTGQVAVLAGGSSVAYASLYNGGGTGLATPAVQLTIVNGQAGDDVVLTGQGLSGFTMQVKNGGAGVARTVNWLAQGY